MSRRGKRLLELALTGQENTFDSDIQEKTGMSEFYSYEQLTNCIQYICQQLNLF